jgi:toxin ParE1/3/4
MKLHILHAAEEELSEAIQYYEDITPGLGIRLKNQVKQGIHWIEANCELPRIRAKGYRRVNCKSFPYYIAYLVRHDEIFIVAIANGYKRPEYWIKRKSLA